MENQQYYIPPPIVQQQIYNPYFEPIVMKYNTLFSCFDNDCKVCLKGFCCPICVNSKLTYNIMTNGRKSPTHCHICLPLICSPFYNSKYMNRMYNVNRSDCDDCCSSFFCCCCAIVQNQNNYRQLKKLQQTV